MYDDFTIKGRWWLPGADDSMKVGGQLVVTAGDNMELELFGTLQAKGEHRGQIMQRQFNLGGRIPVIWGEAAGYGPITLFDSFQTSSTMGSVGGIIASYRPDTCATGLWFEDSDSDLKFETITLRFTHLEEWIEYQPFSTEPPFGLNDERKFSVTYHSPEPVVIEIADPKMSVSLELYADQNNSLHDAVKLTNRARFTLRPDIPFSFDQARHVTGVLQDFLTLMVGEQVFVTSMIGQQTVLRNTSKGEKKPSTEIFNCIFSQFEQRVPKRHRSHRMNHADDFAGG